MGVTLSQAIELVSWQPAQIMGIASGHLSLDAPADICIFDAECEWQVSRYTLRSQGKNTPFLGHPMKGQVRYTVIDGHVDFDANI
jgi:dihydroorotase